MRLLSCWCLEWNGILLITLNAVLIITGADTQWIRHVYNPDCLGGKNLIYKNIRLFYNGIEQFIQTSEDNSRFRLYSLYTNGLFIIPYNQG